MPYKKSFWDKATQNVAPLVRKLSDATINIAGTKTQVMRIERTKPDVEGDFDQQLDDFDTFNCVISYPFSKTEIFMGKDGKAQAVKSMDILEFLPIQMKLQFEGELGEEPVFLKVGDYLVDSFFDENDNSIPIILEITRLRGTMMGKQLVIKGAELTIVLGTLEKDIQQQIDTYLLTLDNNDPC